MLIQSLKKLIRMREPVFIKTDEQNVFDVQTTPFYVKDGESVDLKPVTLGRVRIVFDIEQSDAHFTVWNAETLSNDVVYVTFI